MSSLHFAYPPLLLLLLLLPLLAWRLVRMRRAAVRLPDAALARKLPAGRRPWARWGGILLRLFAVFSLIVAAAGPRWPDEGSRIPTEGISIAIILDVSGSMAEKDFQWKGKNISRLEATKKVFRLFVNGGTGPAGEKFAGRDRDLISLIVFATQPETACPLTLNHDVLLGLLDKQEPRSAAGESQTNIGDAIAWAVNSLSKSGAGRKVMVLLSDGEHNVKPPKALKPRQAAQLAGNLDIPIYVIDAGKENAVAAGGEEQVNRERAKKILQEVARITKGKYFQAHDTQSLLEVSHQIDELERGQIVSWYYRRYHEGSTWFALAAFVLLMSVLFLESTFWRRVP